MAVASAGLFGNMLWKSFTNLSLKHGLGVGKLNSYMQQNLTKSILCRGFISTGVKLDKSTEASNAAQEVEISSLAVGSRAVGSLSNVSKIPILTSRTLPFPSPYTKPRVAWVETMSTPENVKMGMVDLHPDIFATYPRIDIVHRNMTWQKAYRRVDYRSVPRRGEIKSGLGKKPWPQKRMGKARHSSIRSPLFLGGALLKGPRGPKSYFFMLPRAVRVLGLCSALTVKYAQNDLHIVDNLDIPVSDPAYIEELIEEKAWGFSTLFIDDTDIISENIAFALDELPQFNVMPVYGLNVYSMLKHEKLVLTLAALERIEERLLHQLHMTANHEAKIKAQTI